MFDKIEIGDYMLFSKKRPIILKIEGMHCDACKNRIMNVLKSNSHVKKCDISLEEKKAILWLDDKIDIEEIKKRIEALDFQVTDIEEPSHD